MIFWTKSRCYNGGKQHNFKERVTVEKLFPPYTPQELTMLMSAACLGDETEVLDALRGRRETYHGDVCTWCGQVVNKP